MLQVLLNHRDPQRPYLVKPTGDGASALRIGVGNLAAMNDMAAEAGLTPNQATARNFTGDSWAAGRTEATVLDSVPRHEWTPEMRARGAALVQARDSAWDARLKIFTRALTAARLAGHPDPRSYATDAARRGLSAHNRELDAALVADAASAGAVFPRLIAMIAAEERKPTAPGSFARCFPAVIPGLSTYPGIQSYPVVRTEFKGQPGPVSGGPDDSMNVISWGQDQDLRWTELLGFVIEESWIAGLRAQLPGIAPVNRADIVRYAYEAMEAAASLVQWFGRGVGKPGLLRDPAVQHYGTSSTTLSKTGDPIQAVNQFVLPAISEQIYQMKDVSKPDTAYFGSRIMALLSRFPVASGGTVSVADTAWTMLRRALSEMGIANIATCWELDHIGDVDGSPADNPDADTNVSGVWLGQRDAVRRADILPATLLPEVEGLMVRRAAVVQQVGQPHHDGMRPSKLVHISITA